MVAAPESIAAPQHQADVAPTLGEAPSVKPLAPEQQHPAPPPEFHHQQSHQPFHPNPIHFDHNGYPIPPQGPYDPAYGGPIPHDSFPAQLSSFDPSSPHGNTASLPPPEIARGIPCRYFPLGTCRYGQSCAFAHVAPPAGSFPPPPPQPQRVHDYPGQLPAGEYYGFTPYPQFYPSAPPPHGFYPAPSPGSPPLAFAPPYVPYQPQAFPTDASPIAALSPPLPSIPALPAMATASSPPPVHHSPLPGPQNGAEANGHPAHSIPKRPRSSFTSSGGKPPRPLASAPGGAPWPSSKPRHVVCTFFEANKCRNGDTCAFLHLLPDGTDAKSLNRGLIGIDGRTEGPETRGGMPLSWKRMPGAGYPPSGKARGGYQGGARGFQPAQQQPPFTSLAPPTASTAPQPQDALTEDASFVVDPSRTPHLLDAINRLTHSASAPTSTVPSSVRPAPATARAQTVPRPDDFPSLPLDSKTTAPTSPQSSSSSDFVMVDLTASVSALGVSDDAKKDKPKLAQKLSFAAAAASAKTVESSASWQDQNKVAPAVTAPPAIAAQVKLAA